jgi:hypothetical protein
METNGGHDSTRQQLDAVTRGEAAAWIDYPPTPVWWAVGFGAWAAAFALVVGLLDGRTQSLAMLALVLVLAVPVTWDRRRRGTYPTGRPPRELNGPILRMVLSVSVIGGLAWLAGEQVSVWLAAATAGGGAFAVVLRFEHEYAAAAGRLRERLK